jgi:hypothetical protein
MPIKSTRLHLSEIETGLDRIWGKLWHGDKPEIAIEFCNKGTISPDLKVKITKTINPIIKDCTKFKIGKTGDAYIRTDQIDYRGKYKKMYLIYRSTSKSFVSQIEEYYIKKFINDDRNQNKVIKAPGRNMSLYTDYYHVYLVTN